MTLKSYLNIFFISLLLVSISIVSVNAFEDDLIESEKPYLTLSFSPRIHVSEFTMAVGLNDDMGFYNDYTSVSCPIMSALECSSLNRQCKIAIIDDTDLRIEYYDSGRDDTEHFWGFLNFDETVCKGITSFLPSDISNVTLYFRKEFESYNTSIYLWINNKASSKEDCVSNVLWGEANCDKYLKDYDSLVADSVLITDDIKSICKTSPCHLEITDIVKKHVVWDNPGRFLILFKPGIGEDGYRISDDELPYLKIQATTDCDCNSGPCCDGCHFYNKSHLCAKDVFQQSCCDNTLSGSLLKVRKRTRKCSGKASVCDGVFTWGDWVDAGKDRWGYCSEKGRSCDIECTKDSDCGATNTQKGDYCIRGVIFHDYIEYKCINPGRNDSYCHSQKLSGVKEQCRYGCFNNNCIKGESKPAIVLGDEKAWPTQGSIKNGSVMMGFDLYWLINEDIKKGGRTPSMSFDLMSDKIFIDGISSRLYFRKNSTYTGKITFNTTKECKADIMGVKLSELDFTGYLNGYDTRLLPILSSIGMNFENSSKVYLNNGSSNIIHLYYDQSNLKIFKLSGFMSGCPSNVQVNLPNARIIYSDLTNSKDEKNSFDGMSRNGYNIIFLTGAGLKIFMMFITCVFFNLMLFSYLTFRIRSSIKIITNFFFHYLGFSYNKSHEGYNLTLNAGRFKNIVYFKGDLLNLRIPFGLLSTFALLVIAYYSIEQFLYPLTAIDDLSRLLIILIFLPFSLSSLVFIFIGKDKGERIRNISIVFGMIITIYYSYTGWYASILGIVSSILMFITYSFLLKGDIK